MTENQQSPNSGHFVFGSLSTDELRLKSMQRERSGLWHDVRMRPLDPAPGEAITIRLGVGPDVSASRVTLYYTADGSIPEGKQGTASNGQAIEMKRIAVEWDTLLWGYRDDWEGLIPPQTIGTHVQYMIEAWDPVSGTRLYAGRNEEKQIYGLYVDAETAPDWLQKAVLYQIFVDRFAPDPGADFKNPAEGLNGFHGGTLKGIISKLDYLSDLGITCLWLTPIFPSPTYHGYDATDYSAIEPRYGSEADLKTLLDEAHRRGIRVLLDYVANHMSNHHPFFLEAQHNQHSDKADWFTFFNWPDDYDTFFGVKTMPKIKTDHPPARAYLLDNARKWLKLGVDGYRLDHAQGATHAFWSAFRAATRAVKPDSVTFGEVVDTPLMQRSFAGRMDGCLDFLLYQALHNFFCEDSVSVSQFSAFLSRHFAFFPQPYIQPSFLDNHDMNRFLWKVGGDKRRLRLASLCLFTLPGPPTLYYGTEIGLSQNAHVGRMEEARLPMPWDDRQDTDLLAFYKKLIALRHEGAEYWPKTRQNLLINDARKTFAYACGPYAIILNNSPEPATVTLADWSGAVLALQTETDTLWQSETGELKLSPFGGVCLKS